MADKPEESRQPEPPKQSAELIVVENLLAPEFYADAPAGICHKHGNVSITLTSVRWETSPSPSSSPPKHVVIGRLVMPGWGANELASRLFNYIKQHNLDPRAAGKTNN
jgi:hypothetical protein